MPAAGRNSLRMLYKRSMYSSVVRSGLPMDQSVKANGSAIGLSSYRLRRPTLSRVLCHSRRGCAKRWWVPAAVGRVARSPIGGPIPEVFGVSQVCRWRRKASVDVAGFRLGLRRWSGTGSPTIRREVQSEFVGWVEPTFPRVYVGDIARPALT